MMMMMMCYLAKDPSSSCSGSLSSCGYAWLIVGQSLYVWKYDAEVLSLLESLYLNMCVICIWQSILVVRCLGSFFFFQEDYAGAPAVLNLPPSGLPYNAQTVCVYKRQGFFSS